MAATIDGPAKWRFARIMGITARSIGVDYFNGDTYNDSVDGRRSPIRLTARERADLVAFLKIL